MKFFDNKKIWQKIMIVLVFVMLFKFVVSSPVHAIDGDVLLQPVTNLFVSLADSIMAILQDILLQTGRRRRRIFNKNRWR